MKAEQPKTLRGWIEKLPEPVRTYANREIAKEKMDESCDSLAEAVIGFFNWRTSYHGYAYWERVVNNEII